MRKTLSPIQPDRQTTMTTTTTPTISTPKSASMGSLPFLPGTRVPVQEHTARRECRLWDMPAAKCPPVDLDLKTGVVHNRNVFRPLAVQHPCRYFSDQQVLFSPVTVRSADASIIQA
jgi:hypothetical protein